MPDRTLDNYAALSHKAAISEPSKSRNGVNGRSRGTGLAPNTSAA